jgi:hypothetical protein
VSRAGLIAEKHTVLRMPCQYGFDATLMWLNSGLMRSAGAWTLLHCKFCGNTEIDRLFVSDRTSQQDHRILSKTHIVANRHYRKRAARPLFDVIGDGMPDPDR